MCSCSIYKGRDGNRRAWPDPKVLSRILWIPYSGDGFTWDTQDKEKDIESAKNACGKAKELILDKKKKIILLDEINIALRYGYIEIDDVVAFLLEKKPEMSHVILTGRNADEKLINIADLVTDMTLVKHHFRNGVMSQAGIEF